MSEHDFSVLDYPRSHIVNWSAQWNMNEMPVESTASAAPFNHLILPSGIFTTYTHIHTNTLTSKGQQKGLFLWGAESAEIRLMKE